MYIEWPFFTNRSPNDIHLNPYLFCKNLSLSEFVFKFARTLHFLYVKWMHITKITVFVCNVHPIRANM